MGNLVFQATLGGQVNLVGPNTASTYNINVPTVNGNLVTTGDTGTVTNTMCATSVYTAPGTIGSGTPNTGAFTTLAASSTVTLSGGTANGVAYLNGSKVVTSGSALVFDGTNLGIGATPAYLATLYKATLPVLQLANSTSGATSSDGLLMYLNGANATISNEESGSLNFQTAGTLRATLDASGNLGLGVTPSAWGSSYKALQVAGGASLMGTSSGAWLTGNCYFDNTNWKYTTTNNATMINMAANGVIAFFNAPSGTAGNTATLTQAMTLDASGNLLVGSTGVSGNGKLHVKGADGTSGNEYRGLTVASTTTEAKSVNIAYDSANDVGVIAASHYSTGWKNLALCPAGGNLLVGTTSQANSSKFSFVATGTDRGGIFQTANGGAHTLQVSNTSSTYADLGGGMLYVVGSGSTETAYRAISVYAASGAKFAVRGDGTIYSSNTSVQSISDVRFKENIKNLDVGLAEIMQLQPRRFDWKQGKGTGEKNVAGFIAQEIETVLPELVSEFQDGIEDTTMYKSVGYGGLVPTLVKAIQEQQAIIESLTARITALEA